MNVHFKTLLVASVCVALVGVVMQKIIEQYKSEISDILDKNPTLKVTSRTLHNIFPVHKLFISLITYFPSFRNILSFLQPPSEPATPTKNKKGKVKLFTPDQLKKYDGTDGSKGPYLAILGRVYNVRKGKKHYGPGGGYEFFSGMASVCIGQLAKLDPWLQKSTRGSSSFCT